MDLRLWQTNLKNNLDVSPNLELFKSIKEYQDSWIGPGTSQFYSGTVSSFPANMKNPKSIEFYDEDGYYITDNIGDLRAINKEINFNYKINSHGFRSQHFKKLDINKKNVLTAGCSHSFGYGLPEELRWQSFLKNNLKIDNVDFFDLSVPGGSIRLIVRNIISFIRNYGAPDYICVIFPDFARDFMYNEHKNNFQSVTANSQFLTRKDEQPKIFNDYSKLFNEYDAIMKCIEYIWALEELCYFAKIKLHWSTWSLSTEQVFSSSGFKFSFTHASDYFKSYHTKIENKDNLEYWEVANDNKHFGSSWTSWIGNLLATKFDDNV